MQLQQCRTGVLEEDADVGGKCIQAVLLSCRTAAKCHCHAAEHQTRKGGDHEQSGHSSLQPHLVEELHFKQPSTFTSVEVMLVAPHGAQQIHWCPGESAQLSRAFLHRPNYLGSEPLVQCTNHLNVSLAVTE